LERGLGLMSWLGLSKFVSINCPTMREKTPELPNLPKRKSADDIEWGNSGKNAVFLHKLRIFEQRGRDRSQANCGDGTEDGGS
jgi:hypothetical protein